MVLKQLVISIQNGKVVISKKNNGPGDEEPTHRADYDQFTWECDDTVASFDICFTNGSPFRTGHTHFSGSSPHTPTSAETIDDRQHGKVPYKYTVTVVAINGKKVPPLDPHIIVDDGVDKSGPIVDPEFFNKVASAALTGVCDALKKYANDKADDKRFFFPFGIQSIGVDVKAAPFEINIQIAGTTVVD